MSTYNSVNITVNVGNFQQAYADLGIGAIPAGTTIANGIKGFLKKANPLRCSWFQLLRAGKLAGKLAVIECCYC